MANIQELLMAAEAKKSPLISLLEGAARGFGRAQETGLERADRMIQMEQSQQDRARAEEMHQMLLSQIRADNERRVREGKREAGEPQKPVDPGSRLNYAIEQDQHGYLKPKIKTMEPKPANAPKEYLADDGTARIGTYDKSAGGMVTKSSDPRAVPRAGGAGSGSAMNAMIRTRQEFIRRPEVTDFVHVRAAVESMDGLLQAEMAGDINSKGALDQALITTFNKVNDPGSVVRESEYGRTPEGLALANRIQGAVDRLRQGGAGLSPADRKDLVVVAKIIANKRGVGFMRQYTKYGELADLNKWDRRQITGTYEPFTPYDIGAGSQQQQGWTDADEARLQELERKAASAKR